MGTFDSIYQQKIRQLEEENKQLKNLINEAGIVGLLPGGSLGPSAAAAARALRRLKNLRDNNIPLNRRPPQGTPAPTGGAGGTPLAPKPSQMNPPVPTMIPQPLYPGYGTFPFPLPGGGSVPIPAPMPGTQP